MLILKNARTQILNITIDSYYNNKMIEKVLALVFSGYFMH